MKVSSRTTFGMEKVGTAIPTARVESLSGQRVKSRDAYRKREQARSECKRARIVISRSQLHRGYE